MICERWLLKMVAEEVAYFEVQLAGSDPDSEFFFPQANEAAVID